MAVGRNGRIIGIARIAGASAAQIASSVFTVVVTCAHLIAGHDNAKTLKRIEGKINCLLEYENIDKLAHLEACYEHLRHMPVKASALEKVNIRQNIDELRCLQISFLKRLDYEFNQVLRNPNKWEEWFKKDKYAERQRNELDKLSDTLAVAHCTFRLEAIALERLDNLDASRAFATRVEEGASKLDGYSKRLTNDWEKVKIRADRPAPEIIEQMRVLADAYSWASETIRELEAE